MHKYDAIHDAIAPHGGELINRYVTSPAHVAALTEEARFAAVTIVLDDYQLTDLEMIANGAFSPLTGFVSKADYDSVLKRRRLANGLPWTIPILLTVSADLEHTLAKTDRIALAARGGQVLAMMSVTDTFEPNVAEEARAVFRTEDTAHPGVAALEERQPIAVGGSVEVFRPFPNQDFQAYRLSPAETRARFREKGWERIVAFQTRNPIHRAHEYIVKCGMELCHGLLLHPIVGWTKSDDIPAAVRMDCYRAMIDNYFPKENVVLATNPAWMRYAGPCEAIFHSIVRKNYGCTHFIVGRDHAGVGNYYGPWDAQEIFKEYDTDEMGITPLFYDHAFYCTKTQSMGTARTAPHGSEFAVWLSGTKVREMLSRGELPPQEFSRPEVAKILMEYYQSLG